MIDYNTLEVGSLNLGAFSPNIHKGAVVKSIIYDTSKDSDGGAWRKRCADKSWYTETLGGTNWLGQIATAAAAWTTPGAGAGSYFQNSTDGLFYQLGAASPAVTQVYRGNVRDFPARVAIVAESARVVIYDLTQPGVPMWMVFASNINAWNATNALPGNNWTAPVCAANAELLVGVSNTIGMSRVNFAKDSALTYTATTTTGGTYRGGLGLRNAALGHAANLTLIIANFTVNDVAITVLDTAPTDPATGLPVPTIAVATAGGVSVIKDDGTVVNDTSTVAGNGPNSQRIGFSQNNRIVRDWGDSHRFGVAKVLTPAASTDYNLYGSAAAALAAPQIPAQTGSLAITVPGRAFSGSSSLSFFKENPSDRTKSMFANVTNTYTSGWQVGDSRLAALADTMAETITGTELVTNGTFSTALGVEWSVNAGWTLSGGALLHTVGQTGQAVSSGVCVVGKTYSYSVTVSGRTAGNIYFFIGGSAPANANVATNTTVTGYFVATTAVAFATQVSSDFDGSIDNISVKLADADRSVKNNGLNIVGTLTKAAVASGAGLVAYSGFSASNYLEQPYSANLDFGTGDFCYMGWVTPSSLSSLGYLFGRQNTTPSGSRIYAYIAASTGVVNFTTTDGTTSVPISGGAVTVGSPAFIVCMKSGASVYLYVNAVQVATATAATLTMNNATALFRMGVDHAAGNPALASLSLWRISATAPSADQIAHIYRTELPLFQANAQCTIAGTSTAATALAYDSAADTLHVGTSWGRTAFRDLLRIDSEATSVGAITSLSASTGTILTGGTSAKVYVPSVLLRDELVKVSQGASTQPQPYLQFSIKDQQVFLSLPGVKIVGVYIRGVLKKLGVDYTVTYDGFRYTVTTTDKLASRTEVTLLQVKE
jgi:trimeric autotransporter adhesin